MSRVCPYRSKSCPIQVPSALAAWPAERMKELLPHFGTLIDLAREYDECAVDGELTTAADFILWAQVTAAEGTRSPLIADQRRTA